MRKILILKIGAPCSGKGGAGRAIKLIHGHTTEVLSMRNLIEEKISGDGELTSLVKQQQGSGQLISNVFIKKILKDVALKFSQRKIIWLDGAPRHKDQIPAIKHQFADREIKVLESTADDEFLLSVFRETISAPDRAEREDGNEVTHIRRVETYKTHLPDIIQGIKYYGWEHCRISAKLTLQEKVRKFERMTGVEAAKQHELMDLEQKLGFKPRLHLVTA